MKRFTIEYLVGSKLRVGVVEAQGIEDAEKLAEEKFSNVSSIYFPESMQYVENEVTP